MQDYRKLQVWQRSHEFVLRVYQATATFPINEKYGLISQIQRCTVSIPSNIAEGSARNTNADFARFLHIALGSAAELDYQLLLSRDLSFIDAKLYESLADELTQIRKMLYSFTKKLKANH